MTHTALEKSIYLKATPAKVWDYLTNPEKLALWFHKPQTPLVAGSYEMFGVESGDKLMWGEVLVAEPFTRLEYSFSIAPMAGQSSIVKWTLQEVAGGTKLSLRHEGLPAGTEAFGLILALDKGWDNHLARLRTSTHDVA
ncbi:SRPBCC family protein [Epibacterium ulvae]|uniref:SRPBCC family protein n=1 Tax=Epibacterium ulvae TaxID=1156985 RepID=UPI002492E975|nr:SRPBCC domain-containing protein [Epibacterium ulvae]